MPRINGLIDLQNWNENSPFVGGLMLPAFDSSFNKDKKGIFEAITTMMANRVLGMFEYKGLPETLKAETIEKYLISCGYAIVTKVPEKEEYKGGGIYCLPGSYGGEYDADLLPTECTITSTWLRYSVSRQRIGEDCVLIRNDPFFAGLAGMFSLYGAQMADAHITLRLQGIDHRVSHILKCNDDTAKGDAEAFLKKLEDGELGVIGGDAFMDIVDFDTKEYSSNATSSMKDTLETLQWLSAHWFIELGLNDNYNMKREAINSTETDANSDTLLPLAEMMLEYRRKGVEEINRLYGTDISVDFKGAWKRVAEEMELAQEAKEAEVEAIEKQADEPMEEPQAEETKGESEDA